MGVSRRGLLIGAAGTAGVLVLGAAGGYELVEHDVLPGRLRLNAMLGEDPPPPDVPQVRPGPMVNGTFASAQRNGIDVMFPTQSILAPTCLLINEYAGSGGDLFPWFYKKNNQGKLIGKRTWGGLVGITGNLPLVDGGGVTVPEFGLYDPETGKWIAENTGIDPDIEVDARPDLIAAGRDPQIEKAVETLLAEIKKGRKPIKVPAFPDIRKKG